MYKVGTKVELLVDYSGYKKGEVHTILKVQNNDECNGYFIKRPFNGMNFFYTEEVMLSTNRKRKRKLKNLKQFHELEEGKFYRILHGGDVDHGYDYQLIKGVLRNVSKNRASSVPFNTSTRFLETTQSLFKFDSLDHDVVFQDGGIKVGCQNLSIKDAKEIAFQILDRY